MPRKTIGLRQCMEVLLELCLQKVDILQDLDIRPLARRQVLTELEQLHSSHSSQVGLGCLLNQVLQLKTY